MTLLAGRRLPKPGQVTSLLRFKPVPINSAQRRLASALTIADLRRIAQRRTPRAPFDFVDGAADQEAGLQRARALFRRVQFHPRVLVDVSEVDTSREVLGRRSALPFGLAPTGLSRILHWEGERAVAAAAAAAQIPYVVSTGATIPIEQLRRSNPDARLWSQLFLQGDREAAAAMLRRAVASGCDALVVTVDVPTPGNRLRDIRHGMTIPPTLSLRSFANVLRYPHWWLDVLTRDPIAITAPDGTPVVDFAKRELNLFASAMTFDDLGWIRDLWPGKCVVKGVLTVADAKILAGLGVDAIVLSTHGGRQLDRAVAPLALLRDVVAEVGSAVEVHLDSGITTGADIVAAIALGADFSYVGRAYLYGLMAGGRPGVERAIEILAKEVASTMRLLGVTSLGELGPEHVTL